MRTRANLAIKPYENDTSKRYLDQKVWVKNFNLSKRRDKYDFDAYNTLYNYSKCDVIFKCPRFMVIGKVNVLGFEKPLTPTIFHLKDFETNNISRHARVKEVIDSGNNLEVKFIEDHYTNEMTLVLRGVEQELKEQIKTCYNNR